MIERNHPKLSVGAQCQLLSISRSSFYYTPLGETEMNLDLMLLIDKQFLETPFYGVRQMTWHFQNEGHAVNEKRIRRLMRLMRVRRENSPPDCFPNLLTADLPKAQHQQAREGAQDLSLPAGRAADRSAQSGLVRRHHLPAHAQGLPLSGGHPLPGRPLRSKCREEWTGSPARCWPGGSPTRLRPTSASRR